MFNQTAKIVISESVYACVLNESSVLLSLNPHYLANKALDLVKRNELMQGYLTSLLYARPAWLVDCVLSYDTVLIEYDCVSVDHYAVLAFLKKINITSSIQTGKTHEIEVCYDVRSDAYPNDIELVEDYSSLEAPKIIDLHTSQLYSVFAIGFMPNFAYLGEIDAKISMPRLAEPRLKVPTGAVAIADNQTAIYPSESPGGWHILGFAPSFIIKHTCPKFSAGDKVQFVKISQQTFYKRLEAQSSEKA